MPAGRFRLQLRQRSTRRSPFVSLFSLFSLPLCTSRFLVLSTSFHFLTAPAMAPARVLISGSGIAGPIVAMQLARAGVRPTIVERASSLRTAGQTLDINGFARELIRKLGTEEAIRAACTGEKGTHIVDTAHRIRASLPVGFGPTNEYEIVRHRLCKVSRALVRA
ncbi:hypothetical protein BCR35DRAFT_301070 [Leucosporidium creatinivorum]|uniref:FAD-binding domain-containing protein n=1 Tax=Leucosporidium creatinivorum TaxID=106004 RepID=A0A1Y2FYX1_9BASI|nr:hypothetical protein BCR35DRAFT_301070 [Leucosporidium creatinivorum]